GQKFSCVVTEVNPDRRNLVLSRRAVLEREKAESKQKLIKELKIGEVREGIVTRIQPFGAFVDLGGIDGLLHISQLSWDRIKHPSEVVEEGQKIKVKIAKIATDTGKIGLAYRDTFENPWATVQDRYQSKLRVTGTVTRLMDFGAFVRLEAGIEGLIHVSELAHRRVFRASDVLSEGQEVDVMVLSVDPEAQRISLSLKALEARPEPAKGTGKSEADTDTPVPSPPLPKRKQSGDLKGGTNRPSGGDQFGLKW
ncbi:MAG: S1 RNA-binding domain-containing protein, partial [Planctomycetales bacterium]